MKAEVEEIHYILLPRFEINKVHVPNVFSEFVEELTHVADHGIDLGFLGIKEL